MREVTAIVFMPDLFGSLKCQRIHADIGRPDWLSRQAAQEVPISDISDLFDDLVGSSQQRFRDGKAERFGGLEVDDEAAETMRNLAKRYFKKAERQ